MSILLVTAYAVNVAVAGSLSVILIAGSAGMDRVYGPDTPARRILACLYGAIAAASLVGLGAVFAKPALAFAIAQVLFPLQILYKLATFPVVRDLRNPVPWANLSISLLLGAALLTLTP